MIAVSGKGSCVGDVAVTRKTFTPLKRAWLGNQVRERRHEQIDMDRRR
jgi:hypothetical protein